MSDGIHNRKDMGRCHCGGLYRVQIQSKVERERHMHYAYCLACGATRYLSDKEAEMAEQARKNA